MQPTMCKQYEDNKMHMNHHFLQLYDIPSCSVVQNVYYVIAEPYEMTFTHAVLL